MDDIKNPVRNVQKHQFVELVIPNNAFNRPKYYSLFVCLRAVVDNEVIKHKGLFAAHPVRTEHRINSCPERLQSEYEKNTRRVCPFARYIEDSNRFRLHLLPKMEEFFSGTLK